MTIYVGYVGAKSCTSGPQDGNVELLQWFLRAYPDGHSDGIYNCRDQRGSTALSVHGEGRASDLGVPGPAEKWQELADFLRLNSKELGIQCIIYNKQIWSGAYPYEGWRAYDGLDPHTGHLHVELCWPAAAGTNHLTIARIVAVVGGAKPVPPAPPVRSAVIAGKVTKLQRLVDVAQDSIYGPVTDNATLAMRRAAYTWTGGESFHFSTRRIQYILGVAVDGIRGPITNAAMTAWIKHVQGIVGVVADGFWGPVTDSAFWHFRKLAIANH